jgi:hypothetical protein
VRNEWLVGGGVAKEDKAFQERDQITRKLKVSKSKELLIFTQHRQGVTE